MKKDIHPTYYPNAAITCSCGAVIKTGSTVKEMRVEICSACHPFYTGKKKIIDATGRVERFKKLAEKAEKVKTARAKVKIKKTKAKKPKKLAAKSAKKKTKKKITKK